MKRTYLGKKGYTIFLEDFSKTEIDKIKEDLTFKPFSVPGYGPEPTPFSVYGISKEKMFLPKFYGIKTFGKPQEVKIGNGDSIDIKFKGSLRENQLEPVAACLKAAKETGGGILHLGCAAGKTVMSLNIIATLGVKALVVVKNDFLMNQWIERIGEFLPDARVGILQQNKVQIENKDIVIGMLQSISMRDYGNIFKDFGIVFYDEVHGVPSKVFSKALRKIQTRYHFGLSATPNRTDGMTKATKLFIGPVIYKLTGKQKKNPKKVQVFTVGFNKLPESKFYKSLLNYKRKADVVKMISNKVKCPERLSLISKIICFFLKDKRHILVLSKRVQYLKDIEKEVKKELGRTIIPELSEIISDKAQVPTKYQIGYYIGGMKNADRKKSESAHLLLATYDMAKEAMDIPILDTLFMVTSVGSIEQATGRMQRKPSYPEDRPPLIIDFVDKFSSFQNQARRRVDYYNKKHYPVNNFKFYVGEIKKLFTEMKDVMGTFPSYVPPDDIEDQVEVEPIVPQVSKPLDDEFYDLLDGLATCDI